MDKKRKSALIQEIDTLRGELKSFQSREAEWERVEQERQPIHITRRMPAKKTLLANERRFQALLENSAEAIALVDGDGTMLYHSPSYSQMLGYRGEERKGQNAFDLVHPEDRKQMQALFGEIIQKASRAVLPPTRVRHKDGSWRLVEGTANNLLAEPSVQAIVINFHDITERTRAEESLHENDKLLRMIADNIPAMISYIGQDRRYRFVNQRFAENFGKPIEAMIDKPYQEIVGEAYYQATLNNVDDAFSGRTISNDTTINLPGIGKRWLMVSYTPDVDELGKVKGIFIDAYDITERKQMEKLSAENENKFKYIFDNSIVGKSITFPAGEIQANKAFCEMLGYSQEELQKIKWQDITHPDDIELSQREVDSILSGEKKAARFTKRYLHKNGSIVWADVSTSLRRDNQGNPLYFLTTVVDITQRKQAEEELEAFSYTISHDLRAPLRAIDGFSRILLEEYASQLPAEAQRYLGMVHNNTQQMGNLLEDLLAFSRLGRLTLKKQRVAPADLTRQVLIDLCAEQEGRQVDIMVGNLPACQADPVLLKQIFVNLLSNALKFTRKREIASIEIGCKPGSGENIYYVKDNGVGFDMQYVDKLFGVFQRLHRAEEYEGTGVGLAIVQRIVHRHGGRVWAEAEVDKGATFYFTLGGDPL